MYVDIVISNVFNLNKHFFFYFLFSSIKITICSVSGIVHLRWLMRR